jgi:hypothetical protein
VRAVVGAVEGEVPERLELRLDPVEPRRVGRGVGELDVVSGSPLPDAGVGLGRKVWTEVVEDDGDADVARVQRP